VELTVSGMAHREEARILPERRAEKKEKRPQAEFLDVTGGLAQLRGTEPPLRVTGPGLAYQVLTRWLMNLSRFRRLMITPPSTGSRASRPSQIQREARITIHDIDNL